MITETPLFHAIFEVFFCLFICTMFAFDTILLLATLAAKKDPHIPFAYIIVMTTSGILGKVVYLLDFISHLILPLELYGKYRLVMGKEVSFLTTWTYYVVILVSVLMTIHRLFALIRPFNVRVFSRKRIFGYSGGIALISGVIFIIPVYSTCPRNFDAGKMAFTSDCTHFLNAMVDDYFFFIVILLFLINCTLVIYVKISRRSQVNPSTSLSESQKRREQVLTLQAIGLSLFLSIYEVGKFLMFKFPDAYYSLPPVITQIYVYIRFMSVPAINFYVYYVQSVTGRRIVNRYLKIGNFPKTVYVTNNSLNS